MDRRRRALVLAGLASLMTQARAQASITRTLPFNQEALPVIGLGTWQTFDVGAAADERAPLREVLKLLGGNVIDSSPMYGASEAVVGELLAELGLRSRVFLATKVWTSGREEGLRQVQTSFRRLRTERMDLMQVHNLLDVQGHTKTLLNLKAQGKVRYIGITHYTSSAYAEVERWLKTRQYDFLQINYSLGEREAERRLLPLAAELKVAVIANRPFAEGALFRRVKGKPLPAWAAELGIATWAQYFLKWLVGHRAVTCAIPGTARPEHMADNLAAGRGALPDDAQRRLMAEYYDAL
jgi:diketogulonate reductase-like aldo/keto reductase